MGGWYGSCYGYPSAGSMMRWTELEDGSLRGYGMMNYYYSTNTLPILRSNNTLSYEILRRKVWKKVPSCCII